ncbi:MAG TPA: hypothetical protein VFQ51_04510 [Vicinamibacteria bacterium]|nr:hypothetical protein [Vicinamibacteria bacterium]
MTRVAVAVLTFLALPRWSAAGETHVIAVDSSRALFEIDITSGAKTPIGTVTANAGTTGALTVGPGNVVYLSSTSLDSLFTLDVGTGNATLVGAYGDPAVVMHGLEYVPSTDTLYGASSHNAGIYVINRTTGAATLVGLTGLASFTNLAWNPVNATMYATNSGSDSFYTVNLTTGAATLVGPLNGPTNPNGLAYHLENGNLYMVDNNTDNFYTIDMATGAATVVGPMGTGNLLGLAYINGPIPVELMGFTVE